MRLIELRIGRLPGLQGSIHLQRAALDGPLVVIHGPNGCGKSSLVRALRGLLWESEVVEPVEADARLELHGEEWTVERRDGRTRWQRAGRDVERPATLPEVHQAAHLLIGLDELRRADQGRDIEAALRRELSGGYDLSAAMAALNSRHPVNLAPQSTEASEFKAARTRRNQAEASQEKALDEEDSLPGLDRRLQRARAAEAERARIDEALGRLDALDRFREAEAALALFPDWLANMRPDDPERFHTLGVRLRQAAQDQADAGKAEQEAQAAAQAADLPDVLPDELLAELEARVQTLRAHEREIDEERRRLTELRGERAEVQRQAGAMPPDAGTPQLDRKKLDEVEKLVLESVALRARRAAVEAEAARLAGRNSETEPHAGAIPALEAWLSAPADDATGWKGRVLLGAGVVLLLGAGAVAWLSEPHAAWLALLAALIVWLAWRGSGRVPAARGLSRDAAREQYEQTGEPSPATWTAAAVRRRLDELRRSADRARQAASLAERRRELVAAEDALGQDEARHAQVLAALRANFDVPAELSEIGLVAWFRDRAKLRDLADSEARHAAALADCEAEARRDLGTLIEALAGRVLAPVDVTAAQAAVEALRRRSAALQQARRDAGQAAARRERAGETLRSVEQELAALRERLSLPPGEEGELRLREGSEQLEDFASKRDDHKRALFALQSIGATSTEFADVDRAELEARAQACADEAETVEDLRQEIADLRARIKEAGKSRELEESRSKFAAAESALQRKFEAVQMGVLVQLLVEQVRNEHEAESEAPLEALARGHFTRFTHGRYELRASRSSDGTVVLGAREDGGALQPLPLRELSDGTRAQLLLAARLAYLERIEGDEKLPLILDDALATSDPQRTLAIGAALREEARTGRQVLVLTADPGDVALLVGDGPGDEVRATDLGGLRGEQAVVVLPERLRLPATTIVPAPDGMTAEAYGEALGVPPPGVQFPVQDLHLFWVGQHDLASLHGLLRLHVTSVGQLERLAADFALPEEALSFATSLQPWITMAAATLAARKVGRGRPLDREALKSARVSPRTFERIEELAGKLGWDAKKLVEALAENKDPLARGYHSSIRERNRVWWRDHGYLDEEESLTLEQGWERVLSALVVSGLAPGSLPVLRQRFEQLWAACGD